MWATAVCEMHLESQSIFYKNTFYFFHIPITRYLLTEGRSKLTIIKICCKCSWECKVFSTAVYEEMRFLFSFFL